MRKVRDNRRPLRRSCKHNLRSSSSLQRGLTKQRTTKDIPHNNSLVHRVNPPGIPQRHKERLGLLMAKPNLNTLMRTDKLNLVRRLDHSAVDNHMRRKVPRRSLVLHMLKIHKRSIMLNLLRCKASSRVWVYMIGTLRQV